MSKSNNRKGADDIYDQNPNIFTNGAFNVWQRGDNFDGTFKGKYTADRWIVMGDAGCVMQKDLNGDQFLSIKQTATSDQTILQRIEAQFLDPIEFMENKSITISFKVLTQKTSGHTLAKLTIYEPAARDDWSTSTAAALFEKSYSADGNLKTFEFTFDASKYDFHKGLAFEIGLDRGSSEVSIFHAKAEFNDYATPFIPDHPQVELAKCQRYYYPVTPGDGGTGLIVLQGYNESAGSSKAVNLTFPITMRGIPIITNTQIRERITAGNWVAATGVSYDASTKGIYRVQGSNNLPENRSVLFTFEADAEL